MQSVCKWHSSTCLERVIRPCAARWTANGRPLAGGERTTIHGIDAALARACVRRARRRNNASLTDLPTWCRGTRAFQDRRGRSTPQRRGSTASAQVPRTCTMTGRPESARVRRCSRIPHRHRCGAGIRPDASAQTQALKSLHGHRQSRTEAHWTRALSHTQKNQRKNANTPTVRLVVLQLQKIRAQVLLLRHLTL